LAARPALFALLAAALFGAATPASKWLLAELAPFQLAGLLYLGAALGVAPLALRQGAPLPRGRASALRLAGAVALGGVVGPVLLLFGLRLASAASVSLWLNLEVAATALLGALFFRDPLGRMGWLGAGGVVAAGGLLCAGEGGAAGLAAGALVAAACLCWGLDNHWTALLDGLPASATTLWKGAVAGSVNLAIGAAAAPWQAPPAALLGALALGALSYGASVALYIHAAQGLGATRAQLLFASAPFFGLALAGLWLGESLAPLQLAAAALLLASLALVFRDRHAHWHAHAALSHTHLHRHDDGHHLHAHPGERASLAHAHWHEHAPLSHAHPHWPDVHHRHGHDSGGDT
jgi:drug/metabolite transporter (DMT)-like permease